MTPTLVGPYPRRQSSGKLLGGGSTVGERYEIDAEILAHYEEGIEKERLLGGGVGRLEYVSARTLDLLPHGVQDIARKLARH